MEIIWEGINLDIPVPIKGFNLEYDDFNDQLKNI